MKKPFNPISKIVLLVVLMLCLSACKKPYEHHHLYSNKWSYDEINHWQSAVCSVDNDCRTSYVESSAHTLIDGVCDVCGYNTIPTDGDDNQSGGEENPPETNPDDNSPDNNPNGDNNGGDSSGSEGGGDNSGTEGGGDQLPPECTSHQYSETISSAPTCTEDGEALYTCTACGDSYTEIIASVGHTEQTIAGYDPTCVEYGLSIGMHCTTCGEITLEQMEINPAGHSYIDGVCHCGAEKLPDIILGDNELLAVTTSTYCWIDKVSFTAQGTGEYTFYLPAGLGAWDAGDKSQGAPGPVIDSLHPNYIAKECSFSVLLEAGQNYEFYVSAITVRNWVVRFSFVECDILPDEPIDPDKPQWWEDPNLDFSGMYFGTDAFGNQMLTVAINSATGSVVLNYEHPLTGPVVVNATYQISEGKVQLYYENGEPLHPLSGTLTVEDGVPTYASFDGTQYSLSTLPPEGSGGATNLNNIVLKGIMIDEQENIFRVTKGDLAQDKFYVNFMPFNGGKYDFESKHLFVVAAYTKSGDKVERDEYDYFIFNAYEQYVLEVSAEYIGHIDDFSITPIYKHPAGHEKNPAWYTLGDVCVAEYLGNSDPIWYQFYADKTGRLTVSGVGQIEGVTFMVGAFIGYDISGDGSVSLDVISGRKYYIGVVAYDSEPVSITFKASIEECDVISDGSINIPHEITDGENSLELDAYTGYYLIYKASATGTLTLSTESTQIGWCFTDLSDAVSLVQGNISRHLNMSDVVYIYIESSSDAMATVDFTASFKNDPKMTWVNGPFILDGSAANSFLVEQDTYAHCQITGAVGEFVISWDNSDAVVEVNGTVIQSGSIIEINNIWFGPYLSIYLSDYAAGSINVTLTPA